MKANEISINEISKNVPRPHTLDKCFQLKYVLLTDSLKRFTIFGKPDNLFVKCEIIIIPNNSDNNPVGFPLVIENDNNHYYDQFVEKWLVDIYQYIHSIKRSILISELGSKVKKPKIHLNY